MNHRHTVSAVLSFCALAFAPLSWSQYKVVEPNGRVTYTDRPNTAVAAKIEPLRATGGPAAAGADLPFELRQVAERYPVTLFTIDACDPCSAGRSLLRQRGIPFTEKTVKSEDDRRAFEGAEATNEFPVVRIGAQQLRGFTEAEWTSYLNAAGYPRQSRLPPSYKAPQAAPLVAAKPAAPKAVAAPTQGPAALPPALETAPNGIRF